MVAKRSTAGRMRKIIRCTSALSGVSLALLTTPLLANITMSELSDAAENEATPEAASQNTQLADVRFDNRFLFGSNSSAIPLDRFERGQTILPGTYVFDIYANGRWVDRTGVRFVSSQSGATVLPCITTELITTLRLRDATEKKVMERFGHESEWCRRISDLIPNASVQMDLATLRLDLNIAQVDVNHELRGSVDRRLWDYGVSAGTLNYNFNATQGTIGGQTQSNVFAGLNFGVNLGPWRFRQDTALNWSRSDVDGSSPLDWQNIRTSLQRDVSVLRSQLILGDSFSDGQVFESFGFRGLQLGTDDRMLPDSRQGFAPVVRGVASTNATLEIRQNGNQIYQTTVPPGPFEITDLYPTGFGGNLEVTVTEANGSVRTFIVPYASLPQLLRPGMSRFNFVGGMLRNIGLSDDVWAVQGTVQRGISNLLTAYAGAALSEGYAAGAIGIALNTQLGALATDVTHSRTSVPGENARSGQRYRVSYSNILTSWGTSINANAFFYTGAEYHTLTSAARLRYSTIDGTTSGASYPLAASQGTTLGIIDSGREVDQFNLTLAQPIGKSGGRLDASFLISKSRGQVGRNEQFQLSYSNRLGLMSYNLSASQVRLADGRNDTQALFSLTVPLGRGRNRPQATLTAGRDDSNGFQQRALLSGRFGSDDRFSYGASVSNSDIGGTAGTADLSFRSPYVLLNGSFGAGRGYTRGALNINGSVVVHEGGLSFGQPLGDAIGIVHAPGATGARILGSAGAKVNSDGYAILPFLVPYALNSVSLDPVGIPTDVELVSTSTKVVPRAGAIVKLDFQTVQGRTMLLRTRTPDGKPLPFGADAFNELGLPAGIVGQGGRLMARIPEQSEHLTIKWIDQENMEFACQIDLAGFSRDPSSTSRMGEREATCSGATAGLAEKSKLQKVARQ